jgi:hypothetical protein
MKTGVQIIAEERQRQIAVEGWTPEHDAEHTQGELAKAAGCYALAEDARRQHSDDSEPFIMWPWEASWWKPSQTDRIKELAKAGALIAAEIDRLKNASSALEKEGFSFEAGV